MNIHLISTLINLKTIYLNVKIKYLNNKTSKFMINFLLLKMKANKIH